MYMASCKLNHVKLRFIGNMLLVPFTKGPYIYDVAREGEGVPRPKDYFRCC